MRPSFKDKIYVSVQFMLFGLYILNLPLLFTYNTDTFHFVGTILVIVAIIVMILSVLKLNKSLSVFPTPMEGSQFIKTGIYKYVRHPIYSSIIIGALGYTLVSGSILRLIITVLFYVLFMLKSNYEEEQLSKVFTDYKSYKQHTGKFFPKF